MNKQAPSLGRIAAMVGFSLSCFAILTFLWLSFGGPIPLKSNAYEVKINFPEAVTLAQQADVRISGVNVGKVRSMQLDKGASRVTAVLDINPNFAPIARDTRAVLRQKTLLGETYVELSPGNRAAGNLKDQSTISNTQVEPIVTLDDILRVFDANTQTAFRAWLSSAAKSYAGTAPQDLNDALGNLSAFAQDGAGTLSVLNAQSAALRDVVHNTGVVFAALNQRSGELQRLIIGSSNTFSALSQEQTALADTFRIFPTFLDESRTTLARLQRFAINTDPLVNALKPVADKITPTFRDLGALSPDLKDLFIRLKPVISASTKDLGAGSRFLRGAPPVFNGLKIFLPELNPVLSYLNYAQTMVAGFLHDGAYALHYHTLATGDGNPHNLLGFAGAVTDKSFQLSKNVPPWDRGSSYDLPNYYWRAVQLGITEEFTCRHTSTGGETRVQDADPNNPTAGDGAPPCFVQPPTLFDDLKYPFVQKGEVFRGTPPRGLVGHGPPANYNRPLGGGG